MSYSTKDQEIADYLKELLESNGISCWMAPYSIPTGKDYADVIPYGINNCKVFVIILSENSMNSKWVPKELDNAINWGKYVIPFQIDNSEVTVRFNFCLTNIQRVYAYMNFDNAVQLLLDDVASHLEGKEENGEIKAFPRATKPVLRSTNKQQNAFYIESQDKLDEIENAFEKSNVISITGIGGVGKSELACNYFVKSSQNKKYTNYVWLSYKDSLKHTFAEFPLDYFNENSFISSLKRSENEIASNAMDELFTYKFSLLQEHSAETLIVIDGIDSYSNEELQLLKALKCRVILVSRQINKAIPQIEMRELNIQMGRKLFFSYYEDGDIEDEEQALLADKIIDMVGGHALTIKLLGHYAQMTGAPLDEIIEELKSANGDIFEESLDEEDGIYATLGERIDRIFDIFSLTDTQQNILASLSLIPFSGIKKYDFKKFSPKNSMSEVEKLVRMGWIVNDSGAISEHPLVANCVHRKFENYSKMCEPFVEAFLASLDVSGIYPILHLEDKKLIVKQMISYLECDSLVGIKLYTMGGMFVNSVAYQNMIVTEKIKPEVSLFFQAFNIGKVSLEEYDYAFDCLKKAEKAYIQLGVDDEELLSDIYDALGAISFNKNDYALAREYHLKAYEIRSKILEGCNSKYITSARRRAISSLAIGDIELAAKEFFENLDNLKNQFEGSNETNDLIELAKGYSYSGRAKHLLKQDSEAIEDLNKAIELLEKAGDEAVGLNELKMLVEEIKG